MIHVDTSAAPDLCELVARLRDPREPKPRMFRYWHTPVRLCRGVAIARAKFSDRATTIRICAAHFDQELRDRPAEFEWFEIIRLSTKNRRKLETAIADARRLGKERAPTERSSPDDAAVPEVAAPAA